MLQPKQVFDAAAAHPKRVTVVCLALILGVSFLLNIWNNHFGFLHLDEHFKTEIILGKHKDSFNHPILMMQAVRVPNALLGFTSQHDVVRLGRTTSALWGTLSVLFIFLISRAVLPPSMALLTAAGVAVSPIMVIHAHYLKEDMVFCCFALFALWRYIRYTEQQSWLNALWLGLALGLALSSQYKALILPALLLILPTVLQGIRYKRFYRDFLLISLPLAAGVFLLVNYPLFFDFQHFWAGFTFSADLTMSGYAVKVFPLDHWFSFHFRHSLAPGVTAGVAGLGLIVMMARLRIWRQLPNVEKILLVYAVVFYLAVELTPLKPFPAFIRYVIPVVPPMIFFAVRGGAWVLERYGDKTWGQAVCALLAGLLIVWPLHDALKLAYHMDKDTRDKAQAWMQAARYSVMCEQYVWPFTPVVRRFGESGVAEWQAKGYQFLVASSFMYDRYLFGMTQRNQDPEIYRIGRNYQELFSYPYEEITPEFKTFAFSNPIIRIVDIRRKP